MSDMRRAACLYLGVLVTLASSAAPALGSSLGFHEFLKQHQGEAIVLPRLYEPLPAHVPELSDQALVKLWKTNQFSPILRDAAIEKQLYEAVSHIRDVNSARFDASRPTLGHMFRDPRFFQYALYLYNLDTPRFVHFHHQLVPILRGYALELLQKPQNSAIAPEHIVGLESLTVPPSPENDTNGPPPQALTIIPEPSSFVLMAVGLGYVAARIYKRNVPGLR
jgi:hypothetical protein